MALHIPYSSDHFQGDNICLFGVVSERSTIQLRRLFFNSSSFNLLHAIKGLKFDHRSTKVMKSLLFHNVLFGVQVIQIRIMPLMFIKITMGPLGVIVKFTKHFESKNILRGKLDINFQVNGLARNCGYTQINGKSSRGDHPTLIQKQTRRECILISNDCAYAKVINRSFSLLVYEITIDHLSGYVMFYQYEITISRMI